jgi:hypothetical protein
MTTSSPQLGEEHIAPDEPALTAAFIAFLESASRKRHPTGTIARFNQARAAGCVEAEMMVPEGLDAHLAVGLFAIARTYRAWIRFANAASATDREKDIRGMSIRVFDVGGENLMPGATMQDFVLNSHPVMMAGDTRQFLELLKANEGGGLRRAMYFLAHPRAARTALASRQNPTCHLDIPYWSATPYRFGSGAAVKYKIVPTSSRRSEMPEALGDSYLSDALRRRLEEADATFDLQVQFQKDSRRMPIEDASIEWKESESACQTVARIRIPRQRVDEGDAPRRCEQVAFNPWNCLPEHQPLGSMNRARRDIYRALAALRATRP